MDDTLYSASAGMFHDIHVLMDAYIVERLGLTSEQANELRKYYWRKYGVTYYGLWLHHGIDPHDFLTATHKVDTSSIHTQGRMREAIMSLKGQRPKPSAKMLKNVLACHHVKPHECCLVDDNLNNLKVAKTVGIQTVLCKGWHHHGLEVIRPIPYVDAFISHIRDIKKILVSPTPKKQKHRRPIFLNPYN